MYFQCPLSLAQGGAAVKAMHLNLPMLEMFWTLGELSLCAHCTQEEFAIQVHVLFS